MARISVVDGITQWKGLNLNAHIRRRVKGKSIWKNLTYTLLKHISKAISEYCARHCGEINADCYPVRIASTPEGV